MIGAASYYAGRMWAPTYWPKLGGAGPTFQAFWAVGANRIAGLGAVE